MTASCAPDRSRCSHCQQAPALSFDFTMAFQPIVNPQTGVVFAHEALVRGLAQESAASILQKIDDNNRYRFDQACRVKAVELAARLGMDSYLSINFLPNAVYEPEACIRTTLEATRTYQFPPEKLIFEITEVEQVRDHQHLKRIIEEYRRQGFKTAIDDFGAGYSGLNLLAEFQTDFVKLDMALIRAVDQDPVRQKIVRAIAQLCQELGVIVIAEGVETYEEWQTLEAFGIELFQGYYFARPAFEALAPWPSALT